MFSPSRFVIVSGSPLAAVSDYTVKEQHCRMQRRGIHSESQESRSPDSACSLGYDSCRSSPDHMVDGEVLLATTKQVSLKPPPMKILFLSL